MICHNWDSNPRLENMSATYDRSAILTTWYNNIPSKEKQSLEKNICQKWDSNPRLENQTATWTQRLRPLGHPDYMKHPHPTHEENEIKLRKNYLSQLSLEPTPREQVCDLRPLSDPDYMI